MTSRTATEGGIVIDKTSLLPQTLVEKVDRGRPHAEVADGAIHKLGVTMHKKNRVRRIAIVGALIGTGALLTQYAPSVAAAKALSAPVFVGKTVASAKQGKAFTFRMKTKANPKSDVSLTTPLPPGVSFTDNHNGTATLSDPTPLAGSYSVGLAATNTTQQLNTTTETLTINVTSKLPVIRHVFEIMLENNGYSATFGNPSADPYLATTLPGKGAMLQNYYGTGHFSNDNYIASVSGQPPNSKTQLDCSTYSEFLPLEGQVGGIQQGAGCVYPAAVKTVADQLSSEGLTWKGYMEDMGNDPTRDGGVTCAHPASGAPDSAFSAEAADGYATRHNPFVYFHSITDNTTTCNTNVVPLGGTTGTMPAGTPAGVTGLVSDLASIATTPSFSFITPNLCDDGHDSSPCTNTTGAGVGHGSSVADTDAWLKAWVPLILASPAFQKDGLLEITFDEGEQPSLDTTACCGETPGPAAVAGGNGISGPGGGKVGAVLISPFIAGGTVVTKTSYNHYSSLASIEDLFGLPHLGEAQTVTTTFDKHIYTK